MWRLHGSQPGKIPSWWNDSLISFCLTNVAREIRIKHNSKVTGLQIKPGKKIQRGQQQFARPNQLSSPAFLMPRCNTATTAKATEVPSWEHPELTGTCLWSGTSFRSCKTIFPPIKSLTKHSHICNLMGKLASRVTLYPGNRCLLLPQR